MRCLYENVFLWIFFLTFDENLHVYILVLLMGWWAVCSQPAVPPEHWQVPSLVDEWLSSKIPDNQQYVHRHRLTGFRLRSRQTFPTEVEKKNINWM